MPHLVLSKPVFDAALFTNRIDPMLGFWQGTVGLTLEETQEIRPGYTQYRHGVAGAMVKLGHMESPFTSHIRSGWRELIVARDDIAAPRPLEDPDGNGVTLVPRGHWGVRGVGFRLHVRELGGAMRFWSEVAGLPTHRTDEGAQVRVGEALLLLAEDASAEVDPPLQGGGWRFLTLPVTDARGVYDRMKALGARDGMEPKRLGDVARYAFVRDPDGNWIELSQRASLTGPLGDD